VFLEHDPPWLARELTGSKMENVRRILHIRRSKSQFSNKTLPPQPTVQKNKIGQFRVSFGIGVDRIGIDLDRFSLGNGRLALIGEQRGRI